MYTQVIIVKVAWPSSDITVYICLTKHYISCHTIKMDIIYMHRMMEYVIRQICDELRTTIVEERLCHKRSNMEIRYEALSKSCRDVLVPIEYEKNNRGTLQCRHNGHDGVSTHQPYDYLLNHLSRRISMKTSKAPRHWLLWGEFTKGQWRGKCFHFMASSRHI